MCLSRVDLKHIGTVDLLHRKEGGGHATPGGHELPAAQAKLLGVLIGELENPPLRILLGSDALFLAELVTKQRAAEDARWKALTTKTPSVVATGQVVSAGRRVITASGQITGPDGTLYAHATTTCLVLDPRSAAGQEARPAVVPFLGAHRADDGEAIAVGGELR